MRAILLLLLMRAALGFPLVPLAPPVAIALQPTLTQPVQCMQFVLFVLWENENTAVCDGDWPFGPCVRGLVVGHYQPLADNPRVARGLDQTSSPQSVQRTLEKPSSVLPLKSLSGELRILTPEKPKAAPLRRQLSDPASTG